MTDYKKYAHKRDRFQSIINDLDKNTFINRDDLDRDTAILYRDDLTLCQLYYVIVNAVLSYGPE